ncbi:MAG: M48 family metallopeptidase, partial [Planctomycetaceae bacterium]
MSVCESHRLFPGSARFVCPFTALILCLVLWGCRQVPVSGRRQLLLSDEAQEIQLGVTTFQDILGQKPLSRNEQYVQMIERVGRRIAAVAGRDDYDWEFKVIADSTQNAFCLPGGKVAFYEGIIPVCQSEAGAAVVMSHEIAHALSRHGGERMAHARARSIGQQGVELLGQWAFKNRYEENREIVQAAYGLGSQYGAILPFSRKHESEADLIGIKLMARAGYDPSEAPRFWERFAAAKSSGANQPEWMSTHPSDTRRA